MRVAEAVGIDFAHGAGNGRKRVGVRTGCGDAITTVRTQGIQRIPVDVRSDSQNLALDGIQTLRDGVSRARYFSRSSIAHGDVEVAVVTLDGVGQGIKKQVAHRVTDAIEP